ncbi:corrinoid protein [Candidatus Bathyarchaeota archaeon]|nr:corrinoid protein [Candidatus Bathyarchaeota archaeon]MCK4434401.1 corrinoid protein [Candidatus Bathyarchaeota archaeon]MCK4669197.1 corrinoid protein [Candidatus Bathyarchaeota archaeon]
MTTLVSTLREQLLTFDADKFVETVENLIKESFSPMEVTNALTEALREIGRKFENGELFIVHLVAAGNIAKRAIAEVLEPLIKRATEERKILGKIMIGTVEGDIHDIGKNIVAIMFFTAGFEVYDIGKDVSVEEFVRKARETNADIVAMSALLTTTLSAQRDVIEALKKAGMRDRVKVIVGGAPATRRWAEEIGADGYGEDAMEAVRVAKKLMGVDE